MARQSAGRAGVLEVRENYDSDTYRAVYTGPQSREVAKIIQGQLADFSVGQLINYLNDLDRDVELSVSVRKRQPEKDRKAVATV